MAVRDCIDNGKLMSLMSKFGTKLYRPRTADNRKNSSLSSAPASSTVTSPRETSDYKYNSSVARSSSASSFASSVEVSRPLQVKQKKRKRKRKNGYVDSKSEETYTNSKQPRMESRDSIVAAYTSYYKYGQSGSTAHASDEKTKLQPVPNSWKSVNSSHYMFDNDSQNEANASCRNVALSPKANNITPFNRGRKSQLWQKTPWVNQKGHSSPKKDAEKSSSHCLIDCISCREYTLPDLSEQEMSEMSRYLALDCEFVGVGPSKKDALGRCSLVNCQGHVVFDRFVKPEEEVTDYRTRYSGLRPCHIQCGIPFVVAQEMIAAIIKDKVVVGHAVHNDFRVLELQHPVQLIRDTVGCKLLQEMADLPNSACALRKLSAALLGRTIQKKEHCSITDSRTCLDLFRLVRTQWEPLLQVKLQSQVARQSATNGKATDGANASDTELVLNSFLYSGRKIPTGRKRRARSKRAREKARRERARASMPAASERARSKRAPSQGRGNGTQW